MYDYKNIVAWQKSMDLTMTIYELTKLLPSEERYGFVSQMRRAAVSIPSNIAEGYRRFHEHERGQFMAVAYGSASELETQLLLVGRLQLVNGEVSKRATKQLEEVLRLLNALCSIFRKSRSATLR